MRTPTARSLTLDLLSTLKGGSMPAAALVEAGRIFGMQGGSIRVALARLLAEGRIERDGRARYRLGAASAPVQTLVRSWRHLERRTRPWSGAWLLAQLPGGVPRRARSRSLRALSLYGFAELSPGLHVRPSNLRESPAESRGTLAQLELEAGALSAELSALDPESLRRAWALWDCAAISRAYRETQRALASSRRRLRQLDPESAMVESFLLGGQAIAQLVLDPLLPEEILPTAGRAALVEAMRAYDSSGRACWAPFLDRFGVAHRSTPRDTRAAVAVRLDRLRA